MPKTTKKSISKSKKDTIELFLLSGKKDTKLNKKARTPKERVESGILYVGHLPHGFYEDQLRAFFSQFGEVKRVFVSRSKKTLRSRGYAYVEFTYREVAQIAAEAMNNYLMFGRLLKTNVLRANTKRIPRNYTLAYDENGRKTTTYRLWLKKFVENRNSQLTKTKIAERNRRTFAKLNKFKKRIAELGVDYDVDEIIPRYDEEDLKAPKDDIEEEERQKKAKKKRSKGQKQLTIPDLDEIIGQSSEDEEDNFMPLDPNDWHHYPVDNKSQTDPHTREQSKLEAVQLATNTKTRFEKEKGKPEAEDVKQSSGKPQKSLPLLHKGKKIRPDTRVKDVISKGKDSVSKNIKKKLKNKQNKATTISMSKAVGKNIKKKNKQ